MRKTILAAVRRGDQPGYVGECAELNVVTQGDSLDTVAENLREAIALALEGEDLAEYGLDPAPVVVVTFEMDAVVAQA
jgi:predicted RNase H-like HicB family nuclease